MNKAFLQTKRLNIRPFQQGDIDELVLILSDTDVTTYINGPYDREGIVTQLHQWISDYKKEGFGFLAFVHKEEKKLIGYGGFLHQMIEGKSYIELGYCIAKPFWRQGYATEATLALKQYGLVTLHFPEIISIIHEDNIASSKVARKIGMTLLKTTEIDGNRCYIYRNKI